ncbi:MAG: GNAT family protein, partial [Fulvivirga sp.]|uniref:GNAT family N-acetyltransferase n=1 Tax=Fulvivirga sp. TaxID=1931237 RepID=UPI0032EAE772
MNKLINPQVELSYISIDDAPHIFSIIDRQRVYLGEWLPWVKETKSENDVREFYKSCEIKKLQGNGFECLIKYNGEPVGQIGLHKIDSTNKSTSIGYWLSSEFQGKGIMTEACKAMVSHCFEEFDLNRVEIKCATKNHKSNKIPRRLAFNKEGVLRQAELLN